MIDRANAPSEGRLALPGGFLDPTSVGGVESAEVAAAREAREEASIKVSGGALVGQRNMYRPYDVRTATHDLLQYGIEKADVFMVSTQAVCFFVPNLLNIKLTAGDDAMPGSARLVAISSLAADSVAIPDHIDMIKQAVRTLKIVVPARATQNHRRLGIVGRVLSTTVAAIAVVLVGADFNGITAAAKQGVIFGAVYFEPADRTQIENIEETTQRGIEGFLNTSVPGLGTAYGEVARPVINVTHALVGDNRYINNSKGSNLLRQYVNIGGQGIHALFEMVTSGRTASVGS